MLSSEQINLYIAGHPEWQRKLMVRLRQLVHSVSEDVQETWRAQSPHFELASLPLLGISASKTSVSVTFPKGAQLRSSRMPYEPCAEDKPTRTVKFREADAINEAAFITLVQRAIALNVKLAKAENEAAGNKDPLFVELESVLRKDPNAWANWESFTASSRQEYAEWIADGRKEETRKRRIAQALELIREGLTKEEVEHRVKGS
ncbi:MAG: YdeI/OmpD-associated family protein [Flavobacteriales bacterium]|jgi:hypothetical protein|nr:YdeI/OmpD-associated family protein [Flavobacteriales bacterium]